MIYDACVIGAGASGLVSAAALARRGLHTILIEKNKKSGRKLYATGNGRCNLANAVLSDSAYYEDSFALAVVNEDSRREMLSMLEEIGIPVTDRQGYLYPKSLQASSVVWALTDAARLAGVEFLYDSRVVSVKQSTLQKEAGYPEDCWELVTEGKKMHSFISRRVILAMGSPAAQELGAAKEEEIYSLFDQLSLPYRPYGPALCPLETGEDLSSLAGVRIRCGMKLLHAGTSFEESGEVQFTEYGISGIVTFNLATMAAEGDSVILDLLPEWESDGAVLHFLRNEEQGRSAYGAFNGLLHEKLCLYALELHCPGKGKQSLSEWSNQELSEVIHTLKSMTLSVSGLRGEQGQACKGGVSTGIMDPRTMQVKGRPALAVTGETTDVVGRCGGYNLMYAMISGLRAGRNL